MTARRSTACHVTRDVITVAMTTADARLQARDVTTRCELLLLLLLLMMMMMMSVARWMAAGDRSYRDRISGKWQHAISANDCDHY